MQRKAYRIGALLIVSAFAPAYSCAHRPAPPVSLSPPADLMKRGDMPQMTADALTSEEAYERARDAQIEWGRGNAAILDNACRWFQRAGVKLDCRQP